MTRPHLVAQLSIGPNTSLLETIDRLTKAERKILLVVNDDGRLRGVVTDYDIRQAILSKISLETPIGDIIGHRPIILGETVSEQDIINVMKTVPCHQVPIVDDGGHPVDVRFYDEFAHVTDPSPERVAVVMAGGLGTRLRPMTEGIPKPLLEVGGRPMLFILLDQIISEGFNKIYVTLFYKSQMVIERVHDVARYRDCVEFVIETEPLGTGGSLSLLPRRPPGPFLVMNADLMTDVPLREMLAFHNRERNMVTVALKREEFKVPFGIAEVNDGRIIALREKPAMALDVNAGVYIVAPEVCNFLQRGARLDMPQLVNELLKANAQIGSFPIHEFWLDVGTPDNFNQAQIKFKERVVPER